MLADGFTVEINMGDNRGRLETDEDPFPLPRRWHIQRTLIPARPAKIAACNRRISPHTHLRIQIVPSMRNRDSIPIPGWRCGIDVLLDKFPILRQINTCSLGHDGAGTTEKKD